MRKLILVTVLSMFASTGCFLRAGIAPGVYATVAPASAVVASTGGVMATGVSSSVTVNGQPATATGVSSNVTVNGQPATATATVNPNGSVGVAVGGPGASVSASASVVAP